jgi:hypothetical protein
MRSISMGIKVFYALMTVMFLFNCTSTINSGDPGQNIHPDITKAILPPENLQVALAIKIKNEITVKWDTVADAEHYQVFKKLKAPDDVDYSDFIEISNGLINDNFFIYREYEYDQDIIYAVKSEAAGEYSDYSEDSAPITLEIEDVLTPPTPKVISFENENGLIINWDKNPIADSYVLYRAMNSPDDIFDPIGIFDNNSDLPYLDDDSELSYGEFYYYKLAIVKNDETTDLSDYGFGVPSGIVKDSVESNDNSDDSTILDIDNPIPLNANIHYYKDSTGNILLDEDWYSVILPANADYPVVIKNISRNLIVNDGENSLLLFILNSETVELHTKELDDELTIYLKNDNENEEKEIQFKISLDTSQGQYLTGTYTIELGY